MGRLIIKRYTPSFPIKCITCCHTENITSGLSLNPFIGDVAQGIDLEKPVAIDCEMVGVGPKALNALGRVSVINYDGSVLYDVMVRPEEEITDFRTRWSGIRPSDMRRSIPFACAQEQVARIIQDRIVVGHMIQNDFSVLRLKHPACLVRDTAKAPYAKMAAGFPVNRTVGLRALTLRLFGVRIQDGEHCSTEDARATMAIYRLIEKSWEAELRRTKHSKDRVHSATELLSSSVCELERSVVSSPNVQSFKRLSEARNFPGDSDLVQTGKRSCTDSNLLAPQKPTMFKSSSSSSLLDDSFWPVEATNP